jgi:hypothetical protein
MSSSKPTLHDELVSHNTALDRWCRRVLTMYLRAVKTIKNGLLSLLFLGFALILVDQGAGPTLTYSETIALLAVLNGIELGELYAAWSEVQGTDENQETNDCD